MDNCSSLEPWAFRPAFPESCWISESYNRENEALTKALQISLSDDSSCSAPFPFPSPDAISAATSSLLRHLVKPDPAAPATDSAGSRRARNPGPFPPSAKITKRKSRASKRSPTTYITADPANFRQMVQQVTGVRIGDPSMPVEPLFKPEPHRPGASRAVQHQSCLPTLDTSAFLLDRASAASLAGSGAHASFGPAVEAPAFDFESYPIFPTLESWGVM